MTPHKDLSVFTITSVNRPCAPLLLSLSCGIVAQNKSYRLNPVACILVSVV